MKKNSALFLIFAFLFSLPLLAEVDTATEVDTVTIAILAKDKEHTLPFFLACLEQQTFPKDKTLLYIRTNNNTDKTLSILENWIKKEGHHYKEIFIDSGDVPEKVQQYGQHEWNSERFKVLGRIRQASLDWAYQHNSHYFVIDCDNFIAPHTLETLLKTNLPLVAPLLQSNSRYSNYHTAIDKNGYHIECPPLYDQLLNREIRGLIEVSVIHCTYLIRYEVLPYMSYDDDSYRYEYVIFSDVARKKGIPQYLDNREVYGRLTLAETTQDLYNEPWFLPFIFEHQFLRKCLENPRIRPVF